MKPHLYPGRELLPDWNNPEINSFGLLHPHAYFVPFPDVDSCRQAVSDNRRYLSPWIQMLNGEWDYRVYADVLQLPESILSIRSGFSQLQVPDESPIADFKSESATGYNFPLIFPHVPVNQPVIMYRKKFRLPLRWSGLRKKLVMLGIVIAAHVFCNGKIVGYTEGSMLSSELDLTNYLLDGENEIIILVWTQATSSYLENPNAGFAPGIVGDIYLEAYPSVFLHDVRINTIPDGEEGSWKLQADIKLMSCRIARESPRLRFSIWKDNVCLNETCWQMPLKAVETEEKYMRPIQTTGEIEISIPLQSIEAWSSETPVLYDVFISIEEKNNQEIMAIHQTVGFRHLEQRVNSLLLNNRKLSLLCAVWNQKSKMTIPEMVHNLVLLRRHNLNSIYVRDYPTDPVLLELCDIYGVYVISEIPLELPEELLTAFLDSDSLRKTAEERVIKTLCRDINHPCIIAWSAAIFRQDHQSVEFLLQSIRDLDSNRFIHMIDFPDLIRDINSWPQTAQTTGTVPGWLRYPDPESESGRCYGYWFSSLKKCDVPELSDLSGKPLRLLKELKQILCPLKFRAIDAEDGAFMVENRLRFLSASCFRVSWILMCDGEFKLSGELDNIRMPAGEEQFVEIWFGEQKFDDGARYVLRFEVQLAAIKIWAGYGYETGVCEFVLSKRTSALIPSFSDRIGRLRMENDRHHIIISGPRFWMVFNRLNAALESWRSGEKEMLASPAIFPSGLAPFVDIEQRPFFVVHLEDNGNGRLGRHIVSMDQACDGQSALIEFVINLGKVGKLPDLQCISRFDIDARGNMRVYASLVRLNQDAHMPVFGLAFVLAKPFQRIKWSGKGPGPGLPGLHVSGRTGIYQDKTDSLAKGNSGPGEYGECIWLNITDENGFGLGIRTESEFAFVSEPIQTKRLTGHDEKPNLSIQCRTDNDNNSEPSRFLFELRTIIE